MTEPGARAARPAVWFGCDLVAVLAFVAIGRRSHDETGNVIGGILTVAAPFLIGLGVGWLTTRLWSRFGRQDRVGAGLVVWASTVTVGLVLRRLAFARGTATAFVVVTIVTLGVLMLGWRLIWQRTASGHRQSEGSP